jgi:hypothetical protein
MDRMREEYDAYLRHQRGMSEATIYHCIRFLERFITFRFGKTLGDLNSITPDDIVAFLGQLKKGSQPYRDKTPPTQSAKSVQVPVPEREDQAESRDQHSARRSTPANQSAAISDARRSPAVDRCGPEG